MAESLSPAGLLAVVVERGRNLVTTLKRTLALVAAACMCTAGMAHGASVFLAVANGTWNNSANWMRVSGSGANTFPLAGDTAIVSSVAINVDGGDAAATLLYVANGGDLQVSGGDTLTVGACYITHATSTLDVQGTAVIGGGPLWVGAGEITVDAGGAFDIQGYVTMSPGTSLVNVGGSVRYTGGIFDIDGVVELQDGSFDIEKGVVEVNAGGILRMDGGSLHVGVADGFRLKSATAMLEIVGDSYIDGNGSLKGENGNAQVVLNVGNFDGNDVTLTLNPGATMHGAFRFVRDGAGDGIAKLENQGQVKADLIGSQILLEGLDDVSDIAGACGLSSANWAVMSGSRLRFDACPASSLYGYFYIDGQLYVDTGLSITTAGKKKVTANGSVVGAFTAGGICP